MSWMIFNRNVSVGALDRRDVCVMASDNVSHLRDLFASNHTCYRAKIILVFQNAGPTDIPALRTLFRVAWKAGIIEVLIVESGSVCRVYTYGPIRERRSKPKCPDLTPVLMTSWPNDSAPINHRSVTYFPGNKISNLHLCAINLLHKTGEIRILWRPVVDFLKVALNATFKMQFTSDHPNINKVDPSVIQVTPLLVRGDLNKFCIVPAYVYFQEHIFAVPRMPPLNLEWFRLVRELSDYVWYALILVMGMSAGVSYLLNADGDYGSVLMFVVQPLLGAPQRGDFLSWRVRSFFTIWLMFCFILQPSYMCTLLSELTVPSTLDTINSLDDLLRSDLPIYIPQPFLVGEVSLPFTSPQSKFLMTHIRHRKGEISEVVQTSRDDLAYIVERLFFDFYFANMSNRVLPGTSFNVISAPFRPRRPSPYERFFETAFLRAMGAGALDKVFRNNRNALYLHKIDKVPV